MARRDDQAIAHAAAALDPPPLGAFVFGSHARGEATTRSDVDICLIAGPDGDAGALYHSSLLMSARAEWDVSIFERLPGHLQGRVLDEGVQVWTRNHVALWDYLWVKKKIWRDNAIHRMWTPAEAAHLLDVRRRGQP